MKESVLKWCDYCINSFRFKLDFANEFEWVMAADGVLKTNKYRFTPIIVSELVALLGRHRSINLRHRPSLLFWFCPLRFCFSSSSSSSSFGFWAIKSRHLIVSFSFLFFVFFSQWNHESSLRMNRNDDHHERLWLFYPIFATKKNKNKTQSSRLRFASASFLSMWSMAARPHIFRHFFVIFGFFLYGEEGGVKIPKKKSFSVLLGRHFGNRKLGRRLVPQLFFLPFFKNLVPVEVNRNIKWIFLKMQSRALVGHFFLN